MRARSRCSRSERVGGNISEVHTNTHTHKASWPCLYKRQPQTVFFSLPGFELQNETSPLRFLFQSKILIAISLFSLLLSLVEDVKLSLCAFQWPWQWGHLLDDQSASYTIFLSSLVESGGVHVLCFVSEKEIMIIYDRVTNLLFIFTVKEKIRCYWKMQHKERINSYLF